ncbi:siderophore-interacting protein [Corynebacterium uterequi]|uniref:Siderophore-interacting protein n=1 Tax=Corynebacterium uterequi TaxID=1072256 RepID=A0A0G3HDX7_9CORY|nr:siderophore-interacting protein [Corynebacterium uterequi]AKK10930.1 siderophore-interacting protein [Corynebacterium uterequi]
MSKKNRPTHLATVTSRAEIAPNMVRLGLNVPTLIGADLAFTDHYIKLLFVPENASYSWPFTLAEVRDNYPREEWPIRRTYTLRRADPTTGDVEVDFVIHGEEGVAGPWARTAKPGDLIAFAGPGGAWAPGDYPHFVLVGDETASPAIAAALERLPVGATADVFVEVESADHHIPMPETAEITWVYREGATPGTMLARAVRAAGVPEVRTGWFVHGVAEMIKDLRRFLFVEEKVARSDVSISGYWRLGMTEDGWQSSKREFVRTMEDDEALR